MFKYLNVKRGEKSFQKKGKERMFLIGHFPIIKKKKMILVFIDSF